jgi:hypothetical protein
MAVAGWFYRSFANSFTLCLIVSFVFQALLTVLALFFLGQGRQGGGLTANNEKTIVVSNPLTHQPAHCR